MPVQQFNIEFVDGNFSGRTHGSDEKKMRDRFNELKKTESCSSAVLYRNSVVEDEKKENPRVISRKYSKNFASFEKNEVNHAK